ncbi:MAG: restriction endonuclease [Clostridiales bacterium]|nr:restriction endonuclease [Clostridiales bacterium]
MSTEEKRVWGIHSLDDNLFLKKDVIALGWSEIGDLNLIDNSREAFKDHYAKTYPDSKKGKISTSAGMLYRFRHEIQPNDYVVFPSKVDRKINIGVVEGDYYYEEDGEYVHRRNVKWLKHLPRTFFSQGALYEVGSALSFFSVKNYADEFLEALAGGTKKMTPPDEADNTIGATAEEIKESTKDFILKELSKNLKGYDFELFLADLLRAMGYRAEVSPQGGDSGIDITAYKDELPPRILVQAKSGDGDIKEATIQSLKGAMREGDYGLFVTLADYKPNARKYLQSVPIIKGINGLELVDLILKYYEDLDEKYQQIIPLEKVYIPVPKEE